MGLMGPMGAIGSTGQTGVAGQLGSTGPAGSIGSPGLIGSTGPTGLTGNAGVAGQLGSTGPAGSIGSPGLIGSTGPTGLTGDAGVAGQLGSTGPVGSIGSPGLIGSPGPTGLTGDAGLAGSTGPAGTPGPAGTCKSFFLDPFIIKLHCYSQSRPMTHALCKTFCKSLLVPNLQACPQLTSSMKCALGTSIISSIEADRVAYRPIRKCGQHWQYRCDTVQVYIAIILPLPPSLNMPTYPRLLSHIYLGLLILDRSRGVKHIGIPSHAMLWLHYGDIWLAPKVNHFVVHAGPSGSTGIQGDASLQVP